MLSRNLLYVCAGMGQWERGIALQVAFKLLY